MEYLLAKTQELKRQRLVYEVRISSIWCLFSSFVPFSSPSPRTLSRVPLPLPPLHTRAHARTQPFTATTTRQAGRGRGRSGGREGEGGPAFYREADGGRFGRGRGGARYGKKKGGREKEWKGSVTRVMG